MAEHVQPGAQTTGDVDPVETEGGGTSVIGEGILVTGNIQASADLRIDGRITGDVHCATLILSGHGTINGCIRAGRANVAGTIEGTVDTEDLTVGATGSIGGEITYRRLSIAAGGLIEGTVLPRGETASAIQAPDVDLVGVLAKRPRRKTRGVDQADATAQPVNTKTVPVSPEAPARR